LVNPSLGDYRALVGFEALSSGLAIIGSIFDGASPEVISNGENGFIIDPRDEKMMAGKILSLLKNAHLLLEFKLQSINRSKTYHIDAAVEHLKSATSDCMN
jgi:glycosyltransferase involved in cell wall biosynthesis